MATLPIPLSTLPNGDSVFGPVSVAAGITQAVVTLDRTVANGLNSKTASAAVAFRLELSIDGGVSFPFVSTDGPIPGGPILDPDTGIPISASVFGCSLPPQSGATARQARTRITVAGGPVAVSGSLVTS